MKLPLWRCAGAGLSANGIRPMGVMLATLLIQLSTPVFAQTECLEFRDPEVMLSTTDRWRVFVAERDVNRVLDWIVGVTPPPKVVRREVVQQTRCLLNALSHSDVPLTEVPQVYSGRRSFTRQQSIWMRKYNFSGGAFDRISETAIIRSRLDRIEFRVVRKPHPTLHQGANLVPRLRDLYHTPLYCLIRHRLGNPRRYLT